MKLAVVLVILFITLLVLPAFAFYLPSDNTVISIDVTHGWYTVSASGIFNFGPGGFVADPEWMSSDGFNSWRESWSQDPDEHSAELTINDQFLSWEGYVSGVGYAVHQYSPLHSYRVTVYTESGLRFHIFDQQQDGVNMFYYDNSGGLNIDSIVWQDLPEPTTPEPSSLLAIGCGMVGVIGSGRKRRRTMPLSIICPKCGGHAGWNPHFNAHYCQKCGHKTPPSEQK